MAEIKNRRLVIISNRLPFQIVRENRKLSIRESDGGLVSALKSFFENQSTDKVFEKTLWIGSAEFNEQTWHKVNKKKLDQMSYQVEPLFIDKKIYSKYYNGFCNATLWPLFHYFPSFVEFDKETFESYEQVNRQFAEKILSILLPGDVLWVHDYQLMLLPEMIRKHCQEATIGFFLHIPFPSFELFRLLHQSWKEKIISGLLGADLIGFHTHEYVQHFLKTVQMVRGFDHHFRSLYLPDRVVKAEMFPIGIDFDKFHNAVRLPEVVEQREAIQKSFPDKKIIFSVDRLDYTKGITHRLAGFERFLEQNPDWKEKINFILVVVPSRQIVSKYNERKKLIEEEIGRINGKYSTLGWQPIVYRYSYLSFHELVALYNASDVGLLTPLRDGMNLVAKEYVASRSEHGVLILSELAGAASELSEAILVNPMDKDEVSKAILKALLMPVDVQEKKLLLLQQRLKEYNVIHWFADFISQLDEIKIRQERQDTKHLSSDSKADLVDKYRNARQRLLLLDYDGTLVPFSKHPDMAVPNSSLKELLINLVADGRTDVAIISGRNSDSLENWFGELPVSLVSEHGAGIKMKNQTWMYDPDIDQQWKEFVRPMLEVFTQRSPGSFIENKLHTLVWHYRNVDKELGFIRSRELLDNLHHLARNANLHIIDGNKVIEIRVSGIDKGVVARKFLEQNEYDFVMAIGDDKTDEDMFRVLNEKGYTLKIGHGHTSAKHYLTSQDEALLLLNAIVSEPSYVH